MTDHMSIGCTPSGEKCTGVGDPNYHSLAMAECQRFMAQLHKTFGQPPPGARLHIHANNHDFGVYHEVCVVYDDSNEKATNYAFKLEAECPEYWDR